MRLAVSRSEAAAAQVEQRLGLDLPGGGAVAALHVVGVDHQAGLAVDLGILGKQQVLVGLPGVALLGVAAHHHLAAEHGAGVAVEDALVVEAAGAVGLGVVDADQVVDMLALPRVVQTVQGAEGAGAVQRYREIVAG